MKKAIAALLASFVGLFGYQIVDKALEARVDNLEYQVSSQQEEIESLHGIGKYSLSSSIAPSSSHPIESSTDSGTPTITIPSSSVPTLPTAGPTQTLDENHVLHYTLYKSKMLVSPEGNVDLINPGDIVSSGQYEGYEMCDFEVLDVRTKLLSKNDLTTYYYDDNYATQVTKVGEQLIYNIEVIGKTDPKYAGKEIIIMCFYDNYGYIHVPTITGTINADGTFSCSDVYTHVGDLYKISVFPSRIVINNQVEPSYTFPSTSNVPTAGN